MRTELPVVHFWCKKSKLDTLQGNFRCSGVLSASIASGAEDSTSTIYVIFIDPLWGSLLCEFLRKSCRRNIHNLRVTTKLVQPGLTEEPHLRIPLPRIPGHIRVQ